MVNLIFTFIFLIITWTSLAYDNFEGFYQQDEPCFKIVNTFDSDNCDPNNSISKVFTPRNKGVNTNPPDTSFYLFTQKNPDKAELLHKCGGRLPTKTAFDRSKDTVVIVHGYLDGVCRTSWMRELKYQLMKQGVGNVILVDWTFGNGLDAVSAGLNSLVAGETIGFVIQNIMKDQKRSGLYFYFVGHSYGAYAVHAGAKFIYDDDPKNIIRRMTYLDPAGAPIPQGDPREFLNREVASFVDVIHTDGGTCVPFAFGTSVAVGDADFYPNGGSINPACYSYVPTSFAKGDIYYAFASLVPMFCFHLQSIQFYKVSISKPDDSPYLAALCDNYEAFQNGSCKRCCSIDYERCATAGYNAETRFHLPRKPGVYNKYYFNTGTKCPYPMDHIFSAYKDCPKF